MAWAVRADTQIYVAVCGMAAVNQAVKAIAVARLLLDEDGLDLVVQPAFFEMIPDDGKAPRTGIAFYVTAIRSGVPVCPLVEIADTAMIGDCDD